MLEYLELEGHFVYYYQGVVETESGVYSEAGSFECYGNDSLFENWSKIRERRESGLISSVSFGGLCQISIGLSDCKRLSAL